MASARMPLNPPGSRADIFISYASEDKEEIAQPLAEVLHREGLIVWYDDWSLTPGQSLREAIDEGLSSCRFGVVVLSPSYFEKDWPNRELDGLLYREKKRSARLFFLWHKVGEEEVAEFSPILAGRTGISTSLGIDEVAQKILAAILSREPAPPAPPSREPVSRHPEGVGCLLLVLLLLAFLIYHSELRHPAVDRRELTDLLNRGCWVTYDPRAFDPVTNPNPSLSSMRKDLKMIRKIGFSGVVTFSSRGTLSEIPRLAKEMRLNVIMGIWDPGDDKEVRVAIRQARYADAYCVGHNGLDHPDGYDFEQLESAILHVKRRTGRPATTSEEARSYNVARIAGLGDWLFPDVHLSLLEPLAPARVDLKRDLDLGLGSIQTVAQVAQQAHKPLMLKMVSYPWLGAENASRENQASFFAGLLEEIRSTERRLPLPAGVAIHSAFDLPWKRSPPFYSWDTYTGVIEPYGAPRPASIKILARCNEPRIH